MGRLTEELDSNRPFFELTRAIGTLVALVAFLAFGVKVALGSGLVLLSVFQFAGLGLVALVTVLHAVRTFNVLVAWLADAAGRFDHLRGWVVPAIGTVVALLFIVSIWGISLVMFVKRR
ncbi:MAG: hypothetical protein ABL866_17270 [Devosia sp.]